MVVQREVDAKKGPILEQMARRSAEKVLRQGKNWSPKARSDARRRVKYQAGLTHEEAAELEAIREAICPYYSRYAFVRVLILEFCEVAREAMKKYERDCCW